MHLFAHVIAGCVRPALDVLEWEAASPQLVGAPKQAKGEPECAEDIRQVSACLYMLDV